MRNTHYCNCLNTMDTIPPCTFELMNHYFYRTVRSRWRYPWRWCCCWYCWPPERWLPIRYEINKIPEGAILLLCCLYFYLKCLVVEYWVCRESRWTVAMARCAELFRGRDDDDDGLLFWAPPEQTISYVFDYFWENPGEPHHIAKDFTTVQNEK